MFKTTKKAALLLLSVALLLMGGTAAVRGQSALDGFDPNANNLVLAVVVQPDGKILLGGGFTTLGLSTRNRIARLNHDGTLDTGFDPNANGDVNAVALQADGKILVGGFFTSVGGQTRNRIARLNPDGTLDTAFDPNANDAVQSPFRRTGRFWRAASSPALADKRATALPGSIPPVAWLIPSTRTRTILSLPSPWRPTAGF